MLVISFSHFLFLLLKTCFSASFQVLFLIISCCGQAVGMLACAFSTLAEAVGRPPLDTLQPSVWTWMEDRGNKPPLNRGERGYTLSHERHKRGLAAVPLLSGVLIGM